ncbi:MAG: hypothetical protein IJQ20_04625 [Paludibacteraceae bacterium]|nr:hypothetical protein [Paludibacteraceae bacterium]
MEFAELTPDKRSAIKIEVFNRTSYLKLHMDIDKEFLRSLGIVQRILQTSDEELEDLIYGEYDKIRGAFNIAIEGSNPPTSMSQVLWGRIYTWLYLCRHDDPLWKEYLFPLMKERKMCATVAEDVSRCEKLIDDYLTRQIRINNLIRAKRMAQTADIPEQTTAPTSKPTKEDIEHLFTFNYRNSTSFSLLIDYLRDECLSASDADWARHALALYDNWRGFLKTKPSSFKNWLVDFCNLFGRTWTRDYEPKKLKSANKQSKVPSFLTLNNTSAAVG